MTLSPNLRRQRLRILLGQLGADEDLLKRYLAGVDRETAEQLRVDPAAVEALLHAKATEGAAPAEGLKSPLYQARLLCPLHAPPKGFEGWFSLGHQRVEENLFGVPLSLGGMDGYADVEYLLLEVQVCPDCLYASPFRQDFLKSGEASPRDPAVLAALAAPEALGERARLAGAHRGAFSDPARGEEAGRAACALALSCAGAALEAGEASAAYRQAHVHLRLARMDERAGDSAASRRRLGAGLEAYRRYRSVELPSPILARVTRQIVALAASLEDDALAAQHRAFLFDERTKARRRLEEHDRELAGARDADRDLILKKLEARGQELQEAVAAYEKFFKQADEIWQDREQHRLKA